MWAEYDRALRRFTSVLSAIVHRGLYDGVESRIAERREQFLEIRAAIVLHCSEHGCEPGYLAALEGGEGIWRSFDAISWPDAAAPRLPAERAAASAPRGIQAGAA